MKHMDLTSALEADMKGRAQEQGTEHIVLDQGRKLGRGKAVALVQGMAEDKEQARAIAESGERSIWWYSVDLTWTGPGTQTGTGQGWGTATGHGWGTGCGTGT